MANNLNALPIRVDTDIASFGAGQTLQSKPFGIRVYKFALSVGTGGAATAGTVTVTEPNSGINLIVPMIVGTQAAGTILYTDNIDTQLQWRDFAVTGVTATGTVLWVWYRV